jgi:hypothetical protein
MRMVIEMKRVERDEDWEVETERMRAKLKR